MPPSGPLAGGSKNVIGRCAATKCLSTPWASVACSPGVATSSPVRTEPICQRCCSKPERQGSLMAFFGLTSRYQLLNDHVWWVYELVVGKQASRLAGKPRKGLDSMGCSKI